MLVFNPNDPYPLLKPGDATYQEEQAHSSQVDNWLGLRTAETEAALSLKHQDYKSARDEQHWIGLPVQTLLTPYSEIRYMLSLLNLQTGQRVIDLGAGYGRMGLVIDHHHAGVSFLGYEVVRERVLEGQRVRAERTLGDIDLQCEDLSLPTFKPLRADFYFIYDYGSREAIAKTLNDLREMSMQQPLTVVGRGRASRDQIERSEPWLSQVNTPSHHGNFSIYKS